MNGAEWMERVSFLTVAIPFSVGAIHYAARILIPIYLESLRDVRPIERGDVRTLSDHPLFDREKDF